MITLRISETGLFCSSNPNDWFFVMPSNCRSVPMIVMGMPVSLLMASKVRSRESRSNVRVYICLSLSASVLGPAAAAGPVLIPPGDSSSASCVPKARLWAAMLGR